MLHDKSGVDWVVSDKFGKDSVVSDKGHAQMARWAG